MLRSLLIGVVFVVISPKLRDYVFGAFDVFTQQVTLHSTIAVAVTGAVVFFSFLGLQMTARK